jgi:DNA-binding GntR family transcriptional regulator
MPIMDNDDAIALASTKPAATQRTGDKTATVRKGGRLAPTPQPFGVVTPPASDETVADQTTLTKASLSPLAVSHLPKSKPDFEEPGATKDTLIASWLSSWISTGLANGSLTTQHMLPKKADIAQYLGVSVGTVQNAIRYIEDDGHVESKQRIGTVLRVAEGGADNRMRKQTSKRDQAVVAVRHLIVERGLQPGEPMPSARQVAKLIGSAPNTTRLALEYLASIKILHSQGVRGNKANWFVETIPTLDAGETVQKIESHTLIDHLERDLKAMIAAEFKETDKLPSHLQLAQRFQVSIKTIHDAMRRLCDQGIIHSKRGRYGSYVLRLPEGLITTEDEALFVPVEEQSFYNYQRVEGHLKAILAQHYQVGDRLPPMGKLAEDLNVSSNTVRKALQNLGEQGYVSFTRGRYGGSFVAKLPKVSPQDPGFAWLSVNPVTVATYSNNKPQ